MLKLRDGNTAFYHNALKEKGARNIIDVLVNDEGEALHIPQEIEREVVNFYGKLLGTSSHWKDIDPEVMKQG